MPVTITWDKQFFIDNGIEGSLLSDMINWFDVDSECGNEDLYREKLAESESCVLHYTYVEGEKECTYQRWGRTFPFEILVKHLGISIGSIDNLGQGIESVSSDTPSATKLLRDGQILILRGEKTYTLQGVEMK